MKRYFALKGNVCYDITEEDLKNYSDRGFTITPVDEEPAEDTINEIPQAEVAEPVVEKPAEAPKKKKSKSSK